MRTIGCIIFLVSFIILFFHTGVNACTSFVLEHQNGIYFGTNYDNQFSPGIIYVNKKNVKKTSPLMGQPGKQASWVSRYGSVTFNLGGYQFAWGGMNEAGLCISTMALNATQGPPPNKRPAVILWIQYILDTCATVEEAIELDKKVRILMTGDHHLLCDRTGNSAVIEFLAGKSVVYTGKNLPAKVLTNNTYKECLEHWQSNAEPQPNPYNSKNRFNRVINHIMAFKGKKSPVDYSFHILETVKPKRAELTRWSIVFDTKKMQVYFNSFNNSNIRRIDFKKLDFSCSTPVKMIAVHKKLSGNISGRLEDYSRSQSLNLTRKAVKHFKRARHLTEDIIQQLYNLFESFPCTN